ncbi:hypothetical protein DdX_13197 [Ditylenchus destructor]|uniref:Uncharacterized protein n=1 Tax=Ditylenchus destructor TaxID=166010 RepID=A0AAD4MX02_9BILA|nr:hypothetical protein DdX_13197 [Ditylenchus destructor]
MIESLSGLGMECWVGILDSGAPQDTQSTMETPRVLGLDSRSSVLFWKTEQLRSGAVTGNKQCIIKFLYSVLCAFSRTRRESGPIAMGSTTTAQISLDDS